MRYSPGSVLSRGTSHSHMRGVSNQVLEHREHNDSVIEFSGSEACPRNPLELRPMFVKIAERLRISLKRRRKATFLPRCAERERKGDRSAAIRLSSAQNPSARSPSWQTD